MDKNTLEALGINVENLYDDIVNAAVINIVDNILNDAHRKIVDSAIKKIDAQISEAVNDMVAEALSKPYQKHNNWGEPAGEKTTIRAEMVGLMEKWWGERVDSEGRPSNYSTSRPRHQVIAEKIIKEALDNEMKKQFREVIEVAKGDFRKALSNAIETMVSSGWSGKI